MTAQRSTDGKLKKRQPSAEGTGIDIDQRALEPLMKKEENKPLPDDGGNGLDPNQGQLQPLLQRKKTGNRKRS